MNSVVGAVKDAVVLPDGVEKSVVEPEHKKYPEHKYPFNLS